MVGMTTYTGGNFLAYVTGKTAVPTLPVGYIALFTAVGTDAGTGFTEVSGGSYARVTTSGSTWNTPSGASPSTTSNATAITFPAATGSWGSVIAFGIYDASSAGNLLFWDYLGNFAWLPFSCTLASPGVLTSTAHGYANSDTVVVTAEFGGVLPTTAGAWTGLLTVASSSTDTFTAGVNSTSTGDGMVRKVVAQSISTGVTASFAGGTPGALILTAA